MREGRSPTRVDAADVYKARVLAGTLRRLDEGTRFTYVDAYAGPPVATTLPRDGPPVLTPAGAVPPFFAGLLPEGRRLTALRLAVKTSADDELSLVLAVGADTVGDVQIVPQGEPPTEPGPLVDDTDFSQLRFRDLLSVALGGPQIVDRVALPGVQDKVSARMLNVPLGTASGHFVLKLDPPEFPHLVENEAFFLEAAQRSGLPTPEATVVRDATGVAGLLVRRFDRALDADGSVQRFAQEDGCQVLGRYPADKYLVTAEEVVTALASHCRARPVAARDLVAQLVFAYLTGNGDQHAKNLSIGRRGDEWRVTPLYDVLSSHPYGDTTMALTIGGRDREGITRASFHQLATSVGLSRRALDGTLDQLLDRVDRWIDDLDQLPFDQRRRHRLRRLIMDRAAKLSAAPS